MKTRESGMPNEQMWDTFFDPATILDGLGIHDLGGAIVDLGCGYGTFTIPVARKNNGTIYAIDIEAEMIAIVRKKAQKAGLKNVCPVQRDFMAIGTGLPDSCCDYVMLFNILHAEEPHKILTEAKRVLAPGGKAGIIHWIYDASTPRGPALSIRPRPEQCLTWLLQAGFKADGHIIDFPPYHYGLIAEKAVP